MMIKLFPFILIIVAVVVVVDGKKSTIIYDDNDCNDDYKLHIDLIVQKFLMFGKNGRKFPETIEQVNKYCSESTNLLNEIRLYFDKCENNYNKNLAKIVIYSLRRMIRTYCHQNNHQKNLKKKFKQLISASKCVNRYRLQFNCLDYYAQLSWPLVNATTIDKNKKIDYICCNYLYTMNCIDQFNNSYDCLRKDQQLFHEFIEQIFSDVINVFCIGGGGLFTIDHCKKIDNERPINIDIDNDNNGIKKFNSSMMVTFAILNSLQN